MSRNGRKPVHGRWSTRADKADQKGKKGMESKVITICVYGDFKNDDVRIKVFDEPGGFGTKQFQFQNILREAGYDAKLFSVPVKAENGE